MNQDQPGSTSTPKRAPSAPRMSRTRRRIGGSRGVKQIPSSVRRELFRDNSDQISAPSGGNPRMTVTRLNIHNRRNLTTLIIWTNRGDRWIRRNGLASRPSFK